MTKKELRNEILKERKRIPPLLLMQRSGIICGRLMREPVWREASCVYLYVSTPLEVATRGLIEAARAEGKRAAVPVCENGRLRFVFLESDKQLKAGMKGILEPCFGETAADESALIVMPGVAFDYKKHRLGYGGGYYDRYLAAHPTHPTAALAFGFSLVEEVPSEAHDYIPDLVVTDREILR